MSLFTKQCGFKALDLFKQDISAEIFPLKQFLKCLLTVVIVTQKLVKFLKKKIIKKIVNLVTLQTKKRREVFQK